MQNPNWQNFIALLRSAKNAQELEELLSLFLTIEEKQDVEKRFVIVRELIKQEQTQRSIADIYDVSIAKITRGSNELKRTNAKILQRLQKFFAKS